MPPIVLTIQRQGITKWLEKLLEAGEVIAPVRGPCGDVVFSTIRSPAQVVWDFENPLHPPKQFVLPQTDPLVTIKRNGQRHEVEPIYDDARRILFNVRSCDVKGIAFLTRMHEMEPADASYLRRSNASRSSAWLATLHAHSGFCVCTDSGPFLSDGYDIQLTDLGEKYLVEVGSEKGEAAVSDVPDLFRTATEEEVSQRKRLEARGEKPFWGRDLPFCLGHEAHFDRACARCAVGEDERLVPGMWWMQPGLPHLLLLQR